MAYHLLTLSIIVTSIALTSCGQRSDETSEAQYLSWGQSSVQASVVAKVRKESLNICLKGTISAADYERAKLWSVKALLTWMRAIKVVDHTVTRNFVFSCTNPDMTFNLITGNGRAYASPSTTTLYTARPFGTWSHELGHAFAGLSDTYAGGAGQCKQGQPVSLMCWGAYGPRNDPDKFSTLWPDDIAGVQANHQKVNPGPYDAPDWAPELDPQTPFDATNPWPEDLSNAPVEESTEVVIDETRGATPIDESGTILDF